MIAVTLRAARLSASERTSAGSVWPSRSSNSTRRPSRPPAALMRSTARRAPSSDGPSSVACAPVRLQMAPMWIGSGFFCWITTWAPPQAARPAARAAATVAAAAARRLIVRLTRVLCPTTKLHHGSPESRRLHPGPCEPTRAGRRERAAARGEGAAARRHARERAEDGAPQWTTLEPSPRTEVAVRRSVARISGA